MLPLARALLGRYWPHLLALAGFAFAIWYLDHRGYQRARDEAALAEARAAARNAELLRRVEAGLAAHLGRIDAGLAERLAGIERSRTLVQPIIEREIARNPRLEDPDQGISDRLLEAINAARGTGDAAAARTPD